MVRCFALRMRDDGGLQTTILISLDTVTSGGQTIQSDAYDGFDNLASVSRATGTGSLATTSYSLKSKKGSITRARRRLARPRGLI